MSRTITNSDIKKKGNKFHASADWRDGNEGGTERETFNSFDDATAWINKLESESDRADDSSPAKNGNSETDNTNRPPVPVPGEDVDPDNRGDLSHSPAAEGHTPTAVPTATDKDTIPEPAASEMNPADAENINANIVPAAVPHGAEQGSAGVDPFSNPLTDGLTAADTQPAPTDHDTSNEVHGVQNPNETDTSSSQTESNTSDDNTNTAKAEAK